MKTEYEQRIQVFFSGGIHKFVPRLDVYVDTAIAEGSIALGQNIS
jgi:hypothetical protein